mmetsp:Transcript_30694/g.92009  ORF Transcript_30694/g.92009 Transcript_30694/m.92009 type:complete len:207 (+) Transcript_30694:3434-4054(+)
MLSHERRSASLSGGKGSSFPQGSSKSSKGGAGSISFSSRSAVAVGSVNPITIADRVVTRSHWSSSGGSGVDTSSSSGDCGGNGVLSDAIGSGLAQPALVSDSMLLKLALRLRRVSGGDGIHWLLFLGDPARLDFAAIAGYCGVMACSSKSSSSQPLKTLSAGASWTDRPCGCGNRRYQFIAESSPVCTSGSAIEKPPTHSFALRRV